MTDREQIRALWDYGHFDNPKFPETKTVQESDLDTIVIDDPRVEKAMQSYKEMMIPDAPPNALVDMDALLSEPRCGHRDYPARGSEAAGSGGWPEPCQRGGVKVHFNTAGMPSSVASRWDEIVKAVIDAYAEIGLRLVEVASSGEANIRQSWQVLAGSTIGLAEFNNESCSDSVFCKLDPGYTGYLKSLLAHEIGHNCNLQHRSQRGIMHPSIQPDPNPFTWKGDPSEGDLRKMYPGGPIKPDGPGPGPEPPTLIAEFTINVPGTYQIFKKGGGVSPKPPPIVV